MTPANEKDAVSMPGRGSIHSLRTTGIPKVVRHYTNKIGYQGILKENIIGIIGQMGQGKVFFTQTKRIGGTRMIAEKLGIPISKARYYIDIRTENLKIRSEFNARLQIYEYIHDGPLDITGRIVRHGKVL